VAVAGALRQLAGDSGWNNEANQLAIVEKGGAAMLLKLMNDFENPKGQLQAIKLFTILAEDSNFGEKETGLENVALGGPRKMLKVCVTVGTLKPDSAY
jgi:hypothetical protein